jgi:hypothetical protein
VKRTIWLVPFVLLAMAGCVTYTAPAPSPAASPESDAQAKLFAPPQGKGNVYISRPGELVLVGKPTVFAVAVDGKQVGGLTPGLYYCLTLEPGSHNLSASFEMSASNAQVSVEAGKCCYYQLTASTASDNITRLSLSWVILEPMGKLMVNNGKRAQAAEE